MVTLQRAALQKEYRNAEWCCLSTDDKATINAKNGDILYEIDTGTEYRYNDTADSWVAQPGESGGGTGPTGVTSFNGRTGAVTPAQGDYTAALVGAVDKAGDTMTGDLNMGGNKVTGVTSIVANGSTGNSGVQFTSNGNFTNIVCGVSTSASFSANAVDFYNHNLDRVNSINMTSEATIEDAEYVGGNVEEASRTAIDFTTENAVGIWAEGTKRVNIDANGINVNGNNITGASNIVANGSTTDGLRFESNGSTVRVLCGGTTSASFSESAIDAYEHRVVRVGVPINDTDAARKQDVDAVQTAVNSVGDTVDGIIDGTEAIPYLPEDGGTLSGPLNMGNNKITMGGTPTEITDVTNKGYVDGVVKVVSDEVDGILAGTTPVAIPVATETHVGGIKPGAGTAVSGDGTLTIIVPVPTVEDNGKILVAENGLWVAKSLSEIQGSDNI